MQAHLDNDAADHLSLQAGEQLELVESLKVMMENKQSGRQSLAQQQRSLMRGMKLISKNTASHMLHTANSLEKKKKKKGRRFAEYIPLFIFLALLLGGSISESKLREQVAVLTEELQLLRSHASICLINITFAKFEHYRKRNGKWFLPPFYTHPKGYKMCLMVYANGYGSGKGKSISIVLFMMRGPFDDELLWPFQGSITVELLKQKTTTNDLDHDKQGIVETFYFGDSWPNYKFDRIRVGERAEDGYGSHNFASFADLRRSYLKNNRLKFLIKYSNLSPYIM